MKKLFLSTITLVMLVSVVMPVAVQAATLTTNKSEMKVDDIIEVTVSMNQDVECVQFDMQFDNSKYEYVNNSARSGLDATASNLISENTVRVSAFNLTNTKANSVTLEFKATSVGLSVPFNIVGAVEIGENGETIDNPEVAVKRISSLSKKVVSQYYDENGNIITRHPQTGEDVSVEDKKAIGTYKTLVDGKTIVAYALSNSDRSITIEDIKKEFGEITTTATNPIKTGDEFEKNGVVYTVVIYGDVNKDGKVTTLDALTIKRYESGKTSLDDMQKEAADVENNNKISEKDALEVQKFILRLRVTNTDTVMDRFPEEKTPVPENLIEGITKLSGESTGPHYCYDDETVIATITSNNAVQLTKDLLKCEIEKAPTNAERRNAISYVDKGSGIFEIKLYATEPGEYVIRPIVSGSAIKNGKIELDPVTIKVNEYYTVTDMKVFNQQNEDITNNIIARENKNIQRKVRFYHTYTNREGKKVNRDITEHVNVENVKMAKTATHISNKYTNLYNAKNTTIVYDVNGNYESGQGPIDYISIQGETVGNDKITITVNNDDKTVFSKELNITVNTRAKIQSVIINEKELQSGESAPINLYTYNPNLPNKVKEDAGKYYTILPIKVRDEDGDIVKILQGNIGKGYTYINDEKTAVLEIATEVEGSNNLSKDIALLKKYSLVDNQYKEEPTQTQSIDAIGIAFNDITADSRVNLAKGIEIDYEGVNGRERIKLDVTIIDAPQANNAIQTNNNNNATTQSNQNAINIDDKALSGNSTKQVTEDVKTPANEITNKDEKQTSDVGNKDEQQTLNDTDKQKEEATKKKETQEAAKPEDTKPVEQKAITQITPTETPLKEESKTTQSSGTVKTE